MREEIKEQRRCSRGDQVVWIAEKLDYWGKEKANFGEEGDIRVVGEDQGEDWEGGDYWGKRRFKIGGRKTIRHMMKRMWEMIGWGRGRVILSENW